MSQRHWGPAVGIGPLRTQISLDCLADPSNTGSGIYVAIDILILLIWCHRASRHLEFIMKCFLRRGLWNQVMEQALERSYIGQGDLLWEVLQLVVTHLLGRGLLDHTCGCRTCVCPFFSLAALSDCWVVGFDLWSPFKQGILICKFTPT